MDEPSLGTAAANAAIVPFFSTCRPMEEIILRLAADLVEHTSSWNEFAARALRSHAALIAIDSAHTAAYVEHLEHLTRSAEFTRFVLLIQDQAVEDDLLGRLMVAKVIRLSQADRKLRPALLELSSLDDLGWLVERFAAADHITSAVRRVVKIACLGPLPVPSVNKLAEIVHCSRKTLSREWVRSRGRDSSFELGELLTWITLLRAVALRPGYRTMEDLATTVGRSRSALFRSAKALLPSPLSEIEYGQARDLFSEQVLEPLLSRSDPK